MPLFKTFRQARAYGLKNYFTPEFIETIHGNWIVNENKKFRGKK